MTGRNNNKPVGQVEEIRKMARRKRQSNNNQLKNLIEDQQELFGIRIMMKERLFYSFFKNGRLEKRRQNDWTTTTEKW